MDSLTRPQSETAQESQGPERKAERRRGERRRTTLKRNPGVLSSVGLDIIIENYEKEIQRLPLLRRLADYQVASKPTRVVEQGRNATKQLQSRHLANRLMGKVGALR